jgi:hypothetical protein
VATNYHLKQSNSMLLLRQKFSVFKDSPILAGFASLAIGVFVLGFFMFGLSYVFSSVDTVKAQNLNWVPSSGASILEVHIANDGMVFLQGARIESISGPNMKVSTTWKETKMFWTVYTNESYYGSRHFGTDFFDSKGIRLSIQDLHVGNVISVNGVFDVTSSQPSIQASVIRASY